jgi:hypothetical protein
VERDSIQIVQRAALQDGCYVLLEDDGFVAFRQERGCRFDDARFASREDAKKCLIALNDRLSDAVPAKHDDRSTVAN